MNRLKQLIESRGMTRVELAELMNVTKLTVLNWEHGTHEIKGSNAKKLADPEWSLKDAIGDSIVTLIVL